MILLNTLKAMPSSLCSNRVGGHIPSYIRVFNKPGWTYGFLIDAAYIVDFKKQQRVYAVRLYLYQQRWRT